MQKQFISFQQMQGLVASICRDITHSNWKPDLVVGITRGGCLPAVMISHYFNTPAEMLNCKPARWRRNNFKLLACRRSVWVQLRKEKYLSSRRHLR